jgi:hypothetical protein
MCLDCVDYLLSGSYGVMYIPSMNKSHLFIGYVRREERFEVIGYDT